MSESLTLEMIVVIACLLTVEERQLYLASRGSTKGTSIIHFESASSVFTLIENAIGQGMISYLFSVERSAS